MLLLASLLFGTALAAEAREVTLNDGRVYFGEIVTTEPAGVRLRVPQGEIVVPFHQLQNMAPAAAAAVGSQRPWEVLVVGPDEPRRFVEAAVRTIPRAFVNGDDGVVSPLAPAAAKTARECPPPDLGCAARASARDGLWVFLVTVEPTTGAAGRIRGATSLDATPTTVEVTNLYDAGQVLGALDKIFGLKSVPDRAAAITRLAAVAPKGAVAGKAPKAPKEPKVAAGPTVPSEGAGDAFVPLPGYTALKQGDMTGFGVGMAVAVPTTAAWVGLTGSQSQSAPEHIALSAGGFYLTTVLVNQVLGASGSRASVSVAPVQGARGAQVALTVPL